MHGMITDGIANLSILACMALFTGFIAALVGRCKWAAQIPFALLCTAVAVVLCVVGYVLYCLYAGMPIIWYLAGDAAIAGCVVTVLTVYGERLIKEIIDEKKK